MDFYDILLAKKLGGSSGDARLIDKSISSNGTYNASSDGADGYQTVAVNVPNPSSGTIYITQNGTINVANYANADVDVPVPSGSITIRANGNYDVTDYARANVQLDVDYGDGIRNYTISMTGATLYYRLTQAGTGFDYATAVVANGNVSSDIIKNIYRIFKQPFLIFYIQDNKNLNITSAVNTATSAVLTPGVDYVYYNYYNQSGKVNCILLKFYASVYDVEDITINFSAT